MEFTLTFLKVFITTIFLVSPILIFLMITITLIGQFVGRIEKWSILDSLYYAFITATTVGYGDFRPLHRRSKIASIIIALVGVLFTGIIVAVGLQSLKVALNEHYDVEQIREEIKTQLGN